MQQLLENMMNCLFTKERKKRSLENNGILALKTLLSWQISIAIFSTE